MTVLPFRKRPVIASRLITLGMASVQLSLAAVTLAQVPRQQPETNAALHAAVHGTRALLLASNEPSGLPRHWTFQSSQRGALLGSAAGPASDVNGDGLPDI